MDVANLAVTLGLEFEDVRDPFISVCEVGAGVLGYRGDVICTPVVDNYGPHVRRRQTARMNKNTEQC